MSLVNRPTSVQSSEKRLKAHGGEKILPVNYDIHSHHCECVRYHFFFLNSCLFLLRCVTQRTTAWQSVEARSLPIARKSLASTARYLKRLGNDSPHHLAGVQGDSTATFMVSEQPSLFIRMNLMHANTKRYQTNITKRARNMLTL